MTKKQKTIYVVAAIIVVTISVIVCFYLNKTKNHYTSLAYGYYDSGNLILSNSTYQKAAKYWFLKSSEKYYFAITENKVGNYDGAIKKFTSCYKAKFNQYSSLIGIGNAYRQKEDYTQAEKYYNEAIALSKTNIEAYLDLIDLYKAFDFDIDQTLGALNTNITNNRELARAYLKVIDAYQSHDNKDKVIEYANKLLTISPDNQTAIQYLNIYEK